MLVEFQPMQLNFGASPGSCAGSCEAGQEVSRNEGDASGPDAVQMLILPRIIAASTAADLQP